MNGFGNWLRNVGYKLRMGLQRFMEGRYGTDKLNMAILCTGLAFSLLAAFCHTISHGIWKIRWGPICSNSRFDSEAWICAAIQGIYA